MQKNKIKVFITVFMILTALLYALEWPSDTKNLKRLFGERITNECKIFEYGFTLKNTETVRTADYGRRLITIENKNSMKGFPSTLGNAVVLIHADDIQTIYGNLENTDLFETRHIADNNSIIGKTANTAWGEPNDLIFQVLDIKNSVYINPGLTLPAIEDKFPPKIKNASLVDSQNRQLNLKTNDKIKRGKYSLYVQTVDSITAEGQQFNSMHFSVILNGINVSNLSFQTISIKKGKAYIKENITAQKLYNSQTGIFLGNIKLTAGNAILQITTKDINNNESVQTYQFQVE
ncbi:MAG: peptidase M23 [Treponema sp.]|nr:MAG: peptidase M23 [Treponema sp.]